MNIKITIVDCKDLNPDNMPLYQDTATVHCATKEDISDINNMLVMLAVEEVWGSDTTVINQYLDLNTNTFPKDCMFNIFTNDDCFKDGDYIGAKMLFRNISNTTHSLLIYRDTTSKEINFLCTTDPTFMDNFIGDNLRNHSIIPYCLATNGEWICNENFFVDMINNVANGIDVHSRCLVSIHNTRICNEKEAELRKIDEFEDELNSEDKTERSIHKSIDRRNHLAEHKQP